jgi:hypothetical protein
MIAGKSGDAVIEAPYSLISFDASQYFLNFTVHNHLSIVPQLGLDSQLGIS